MKVKKKSKKVRRLTVALKELLEVDDKLSSEYLDLTNNENKPREDKGEKTEPRWQKNNISYIMSKENQLIPKLSDAEIMERHRRADENMKKVWSQIIERYENMEYQGDVIDLQSGEIIEDHGHLRKMESLHPQADEIIALRTHPGIKYISVLNDLIDIKNVRGDIWQADVDDSKDSQSEMENYSDHAIEQSKQ